MRRRVPTLALTALAAALLGCGGESKPVTEVVLRIDTTLNYDCDFDAIDVDLSGVDGGVTGPVKFGTAAMKKLPVQITFVKGAVSTFDVTVRALKEDAVVVEQPVTLSFVDGKSMLASMTLAKCGAACTPKTFTEADLETYSAPSGRHVPLSDCGDEPPTTCDDMCEGGLKCTNGYCRDLPVARYVAEGKGTSTSDFTDVCNGGDAKVVLQSNGVSLFDDNGFYDIDLSTLAGADGGTPPDLYFYGRKVTHVWVSVHGWAAFTDTDTPPTEPSSFDMDSDLPAGIYALAGSDIEPNDRSSICMIHTDGGLAVGWNVMCMEGTGCSDGDKLKFGFGIEYPVTTSGSGFASAAGIVHLFFMQAHGSADAWTRTFTGWSQGGGLAVGIKDYVKAACAVDECNAQGFCQDGTTPCGFTAIRGQEGFLVPEVAEGGHIDATQELRFSAQK